MIEQLMLSSWESIFVTFRDLKFSKRHKDQHNWQNITLFQSTRDAMPVIDRFFSVPLKLYLFLNFLAGTHTTHLQKNLLSQKILVSSGKRFLISMK
jgi:hypothetical protein